MDKASRKKKSRFPANSASSKSGNKVSVKEQASATSTKSKKSSPKIFQRAKTGQSLKGRKEKQEVNSKGSPSVAADNIKNPEEKVPLEVDCKKLCHPTDDKTGSKPSESSIFLKKTGKTIKFNVEPIELKENTPLRFDDLKKKQVVSKEKEIVVSNVDTIVPENIKCLIIDEKAKPSTATGDVPVNLIEPDSEKHAKRSTFGIKFATSKKPIMSFFAKKENKNRRFSESPSPVEQDSREFVECVDLEEMEKEDLEVKTYFRDVFIYVGYLLVITSVSLPTFIVALWMVSWNMFYFKDVTARLFMDTPNFPGGINSSSIKNNTNATEGRKWKTLREAITIADFWNFAETTMITMFYSNLLNSDSNIKDFNFGEGKMVFENQILGVPRLRQVRVRPDSCQIPTCMKRFFNECYAYYSVFAEETRPIKLGMENSKTATAWIYTEWRDLGSSYYWGEISIYGGGGYYLDLAKTKNETKEMVNELKKNNWLSQATRALFIDFNIYNVNVNFFCFCKIVLEFPPFGGIIPRADFLPLKLIRYMDTVDFFMLALELLLIIYAIYYTIYLIRKYDCQKRAFWFFFWNYIDIAIITMLYLYIIFGIELYHKGQVFVKNLSDAYYDSTDFQSVKISQTVFNNIVAILVFLSWTKMIKYLQCNATMTEFYITMSKSLMGILAFLPLFFVLLLAFGMVGSLLFGCYVKDYMTMLSSVMALLQTFSGNFEYTQIRDADRFLGPIFYLVFVFFIIFLCLNMFVAIAVEAYTSVKSKILLDPPRVGEYLKRGLFNVAKCCCCGYQDKFIKERNTKKKLLFDKIRKMLRRSGFTDTEIRIFFYKYDINPETVCNEETKNKILRDLELNTIAFKETAEEFQINHLIRRLNELSDQIEEIEVSLQPVIDKVDILLKRR